MVETGGESAAPGGSAEAVPSIVVVCGYPGVGKSRVASELGDRLGATVVRTDEVRKELYGDPTYDDVETERVYATVRERGLDAVADGGRAVLDGTYRRESFRAAVAAGADRLGVECAFVKVECPEAVVRERIERRSGDASDAGLAEYYEIRETFDPLARPHVTVDNSGTWSHTREQIRAAFPAREG